MSQDPKHSKTIPLEQSAAHIVRVANGWVIYRSPYGYDMRNDAREAPQLVFSRMADAVAALSVWGELHEAQQ